MEIPGYRPLRAIYRGPSSLVWRAVRERDGLPVVIKQLASEYPSRAALTEYRHQFDLTRTLPAGLTVRALALHQVGHSLAIVMEDIGGESLASILRSGPVPLDEAWHLARRIASAVAGIHAAGIVHRNVSPSAVLVNRTAGEVRLIDFRAASVLRREQICLSAPLLARAELSCIAPEQTGRTNAPVDYRCDYYSLGAVLYELFAGEPPFVADHPLDLVYCHLARAPLPPHVCNPRVPPFLSAIVLKLLAKVPDDRYQSGSGLLADLDASSAEAPATGAPQVPGAHDVLASLEVRRRLYGREREIEAIARALVGAAAGARGLTTVAGFSGIGKTALVREVFAKLPTGRYRIGSGKFDQLQRNVPYSALVDALGALLRQILSESDAALAEWGAALQAAVGPHGRLLTDILPDLALVIGPQPAVEDLPPTEARNRFDRVFLRFVRALASRDPLLVFVDDVQWVDAGSIRLIELLLGDERLRGVLVVAAYRDNEVSPSHPFLLAADRLAASGVPVTAVALGPLGHPDVQQLVADAIDRPFGDLAPLVSLLMRKTAGNPFFLIQFLRAMHERGLIVRGAAGAWHWDLDRIEQERMTDNVIELLIGKINALPEATREALSLAACIGHDFELATLARIRARTPDETFAALMPALQEELVTSTRAPTLSADDALQGSVVMAGFRFLHDRIQQAAYALIPAGARTSVHLQIGRMLLAEGFPEDSAAHLFALAGHLNEARGLLAGDAERLQLARIDLEAARRAREAAAFGSALDLLRAGMEGLPGDVWSRDYDLALDLWRERATLEYLNGHFEASRRFIDEAAAQARTALERAGVLHMLIVQHTLAAEYGDAIAVARRALHLVGLDLPEDAYEAARDAEMQAIDRLLGNRDLSALGSLPPMTDPVKRLAMQLLASMGPPCYRSHPRLWALIVAIKLRLCLEYGEVPAAAYTYPAYGGLLGHVRGDLASAAALAAAAFAVADKYGSLSDRSVAHLMVGASLDHWFRPLREAEDDYRAAYRIGVDAGNLQYAVYAFGHLMYCRFFRGMNLDEQALDTGSYLQFALGRRNQWGIDLITGVRLVVQNLTGRTPSLDSFTDGTTTDAGLLARCDANHNVQVLCIYHVLKAHALWLHGCTAAANDAAREAEARLPAVATQGLLPAAEFVFVDALIAATLYRERQAGHSAGLSARLGARLARLKAWAVQCPVNFLHKRLLVEAELADIDGDPWASQRLYDEAIRQAAERGFTHHEAFANELAARFWNRHGQTDRAITYLRRARSGYGMWGAHVKVALLEQEFTGLLWDRDRHEESAAAASRDAEAQASLDFQTVLRATHAIARTVRHDSLVDRLLQVAMENAGADRGFLVVPEGDDFSVVAPGAPANGPSQAQPRRLSECRDLSAAIVRFVARTGEMVLLDRFSDRSVFAADEYVRRAAGRAVLCIPVQGHGTVNAVLYLENTLSDTAFTADRVDVLKILAAQAAISFENAKYYARMASLVAERTQALEQANERLRREIEQRTRMEAHLIETQKVESIGRLAGGIAHDFNNHLTVINGLCDLMLDCLPPGDALRQDVSEIRAAGERAAALTQQLLAYSRKQVIEPQPVNLDTVVAEVQRMLQRLIGEGVELRTEGPRELGTVLADRGQIAQVLMNLATNARDAVQGSGTVSIRTANVDLDAAFAQSHPEVTPGPHVRLSVADDGCGMTPGVVQRIFDPFFTTKDKGKGTGLGLSTVYGIVRQMGGTITVSSDVGRGTTFTMYFPRIDSSTAEAADVFAGGQLPERGTETVLVVEDQPHVRRLTVEILRQHGYHVLQAANGREALAAAAQHTDRVDLLVTDVVMPGMTGRELADTLTELRPGLKVLFTSGYTDDIIAPKGVLDAGVEFLAKPFDPRSLRERVRQLLDRPLV